MKSLHFLLIFINLSTLTCRTAEAAVPVLPILRKVADVISFGLDVYSFFDSIIGEDETQTTPAPVDYDRIINSISERIEMSTETIVSKIELQSHISELRDVAIIIKQLLAEMEDIAKAKTKDTREELQRRFRNNYERHKTEMYKVRNLLTFSVDVSGISSTLLSLVANEFKCGMTSLDEFQNYYMTLVSDVVALALLNERLSEKSLYNETLESWKIAIGSLFDDLEKQKNDCKAKFTELLSQDFSDINDPSVLFENNQNKYTYKETDVLYLGGSYCVWSLKNYSNLLKKAADNTMTFVFINGDENKLSATPGQLLKIVSEAKYETCMDDTSKIISYFDILGEDLIFWLMYPEDQAPYFKILLDSNSTANRLTTESGGTRYTTVVYVRAQSNNVNSTLTPKDFDVNFSDKPAPVEESSGLKTWLLGVIIGVIIGGSPLVLIIVIVGIYKYITSKKVPFDDYQMTRITMLNDDYQRTRTTMLDDDHQSETITMSVF